MYSQSLLLSALVVTIFGIFILFIPGKPTSESTLAGSGIIAFSVYMILLNLMIPKDELTKSTNLLQ